MAALHDQLGPIPELVRCSACDKPLLDAERGEVDQQGRCCLCQWRNARPVSCECGFLYEGEACTCGAAESAATSTTEAE
jgi:hypothetical protein